MTHRVPKRLATAGGMPDVDSVLEIERGGEFGQIGGICVHVIACPRLARSAMASPVVGNATVSLGRQEKHLVIPCVRRKRPAMTEHDRPAGTPILEVDRGTVLGLKNVHVFISDCCN